MPVRLSVMVVRFSWGLRHETCWIIVTLVLRCLVCVAVEIQCVILGIVIVARRVLVVRLIISVYVTLQVPQRVILRHKRVKPMYVVSLDLFSPLVIDPTIESTQNPLGKPGKTWKAAQPRESELRESRESREVLAYSLHNVLMP